MTLRGLLRLWMLLDRVITELLGLDRELERELDLDTGINNCCLSLLLTW